MNYALITERKGGAETTFERATSLVHAIAILTVALAGKNVSALTANRDGVVPIREKDGSLTTIRIIRYETVT